MYCKDYARSPDYDHLVVLVPPIQLANMSYETLGAVFSWQDATATKENKERKRLYLDLCKDFQCTTHHWIMQGELVNATSDYKSALS